MNLKNYSNYKIKDEILLQLTRNKKGLTVKEISSLIGQIKKFGSNPVMEAIIQAKR